MPETIRISEVPARWPAISAALRTGKQEFMIGEDRLVEAVIVSPARYSRLVALAAREDRRRRILAMPMPAATSQATWDAGFTTLEPISEKFSDLSDDDLDVLFSEVLAEVRGGRAGVTELAVGLIVIFDTNALLSLLVGATRRAQTLRRLWRTRRFELCITPQSLIEVERVLTYPKVQRNFHLTDADADGVIEILKGRGHVLPGLYEGVTAIQDDVSDNVFLAAALEAGADYLVTQDPHLQSLKYYHGTQIISLTQFTRLFASE